MKFSIVIPVAPYRNAEILESLKQLDFSKKEFEIIVEKGINPSENRNRGTKKAKGEIIVFLDDDGTVNRELLKNAEKFFMNNSNIDIVGGPQLTPINEKGFAKISGYALSSKFGGWDVSNRYSIKKLNLNADETYLTSALMFCKKKIFNKVRFDHNLFPGEDSKFIMDAKKAGFKIAYSPNLTLYHRRRPSILGLIKQVFNYGKSGPTRQSLYETIKKPFFLIPSLFVIYLSFLSVFVFFYSLIKMSITGAFIGTSGGVEIFNFILFFPLILYITLNLLFSLYESLKNRDFIAILFLPFIFPLIHLSYGVGWIYGFITKTFLEIK